MQCPSVWGCIVNSYMMSAHLSIRGSLHKSKYMELLGNSYLKNGCWKYALKIWMCMGWLSSSLLGKTANRICSYWRKWWEQYSKWITLNLKMHMMCSNHSMFYMSKSRSKCIAITRSYSISNLQWKIPSKQTKPSSSCSNLCVWH
jgi:hypothetical protein